MKASPNILLIVFDTARADAFSPYVPGRRTPTVEQLAAMGVAHRKAIAPSCWTVPSHASMFLGGPPRTLGLCNLPGGQPSLLAPVIEQHRDRSLPEVLRRAGYQTSGVSTNLWISARHGFSLGFDTFHDAAGHRVRKMADRGLRSRAAWYLDALQARADDGARVVESMLEDWVRTRSRAPFFWFVNLIECHSPYLPPKPYNDLGPLGRLASAEDARRYQTLGAVLEAIGTGAPPPSRARRRMRHLYDRSIELMDAWLARVLERLDHARMLDETIVIVTSDHGENFGEANGLIGHGGSLDDRLLWVPLVVAGPGVGDVPDGVTALSDLPRMIAEMVGLADHPWGGSLHPGIAVAQYDGPMDLSERSLTAFAEWSATPDGVSRLTERFTAATDGTLKLVRSPTGTRLYDVSADPLETDPLDASRYPAERIAPLTEALDGTDTREWEPDVAQPAPVDPDEVADLEERMRLLGYL